MLVWLQVDRSRLLILGKPVGDGLSPDIAKATHTRKAPIAGTNLMEFKHHDVLDTEDVPGKGAYAQAPWLAFCT